MENVSPRPSDVALGLRCLRCDAPLSLMPGRVLITFQCKGGHSFGMRHLLQAKSEDVRRAIEAILAVWQEKASVLDRSAEFARAEARFDVAESFRHEAESLKNRTAVIRQHLRGLDANGSAGEDAIAS